jgi:hypothetical protein
LQSNLGYSYLITKLVDAVRIFEVANDEAELIWNADDVFIPQTGDVNFVNIPGKNVRVLMLNRNHCPIQITTHEEQIINSVGGSTIAVPQLFRDLGVAAVYRNRVPLDFTYSGGATLTIPGNYSAFDTIDIITFSWQWLAESYYYFGDNFHRSVTRAGATLGDQNVEIPKTINSNIENATNPDEYGIVAFVNNQYDNRYLYRANGKPANAFEYSFGDGATYQYSTVQSTTPSPFFVTFGKEAKDVKISVNNVNVNAGLNQIVIQDHGLETNDFVEFYNQDGLYPPLVAGVPYVVRKINDNVFELYTDDTFTTIVNFTTPATVTFTDADIDTTLNRLNIAHPFPVGSITRVTFQNPNYLLPVGVAPEQSYYVFALTASVLEVYFDREATRRVDLFNRVERLIFDTGVAVNPQNIITISNHLLFARDAVRIYPYTGSTLPNPLVAGQVYYVDPISPNGIQLFNDVNLTSLVVLTTTGTGQFTLRVDGGTMQIRQEFGQMTLDKITFSKVDFVRLRPLEFNGDVGVRGLDLYVTVNNVLVPQNTTNVGVAPQWRYQLFTNTGYNIILNNTTVANRIGFTGSNEIGVPQNAVIKVTNRTPRWVGSNAKNTPFNNDNGGWYPIYGIAKYCDYNKGEFFSVGTIFQSRLVLGGLKRTPQQVLFSSKAALSEEDFYLFFQIAEDNVTPALDPFDIIIPEQNNYSIQFLTEWQRALYVFTDNSVFRTFSTEGNVTIDNRVVGKVSEKGAVNPRCVTITESSILFVSDNGVYDLAPILENEYRAAEVSVKIRPFFGTVAVEKYKHLPWIGFDDTNFRVFVGLPTEEDTDESSILLVYDSVQKSWTEYAAFYKFKSFVGMSYIDTVLGKLFMIAHRLPCYIAFTRFNYIKYMDFVQKNAEGSTTIPSVPVFWRGVTFNGVTEYQPDVTMLFIRNVQDIRVYSGATAATLTERTYRTEWRKTNHGTIEFLSNPGNGIIVVTPNVPDSFYGNVLQIDNIVEALSDTSFGSINFDDPCLCRFGTVGYGGGDITFEPCEFNLQPGAVGEVGYVYHAVYTSPVFTVDTLARYKRTKHLNVMFENVRNRYKAEDVNLVTQTYSDLVNRLENDLETNVAMVFQTDTKAEYAEEIYSRINVKKLDSWSVFKEPLKGVGYSYQFVVYSLDVNTWVMSGYQITGKLVGERHISGDR